MILALVGCGEFGRQLRRLAIRVHGDIERTVCFDDVHSAEGGSRAYPFANYMLGEHSDYVFVVGVGYKHLSARREVIQRLLDAGRRVLTLVHPSSYIDPDARLAPGCVIYPMCNIDAGVVMGPGAILNNSCAVSHDSHVGESSFLAPGVVVCGNVRVADTCFIGAGTVVTNGVSIARSCVIGAGSLVASDIVQPGGYHVGNPLRKVEKPLRLL